MSNFREQYEGLLMKLLKQGTLETNARTGHAIRVSAPVSFNIDLEDGMLPLCGIRKTYPRSAAAEVAWFLQGRQNVNFIRQYAPLWDKFVENDGVTVEAAYGYRWRNHFGRDQIDAAVQALINNPTDRRIFISAWDPAVDGLGNPGKNVPCPVGFTLSITGNQLNSTLLIRSSDVFVGLPYDIMGHSLLMQAIRCSINIQREAHNLPPLVLGSLMVSLAHPHLYGVHEEMVMGALAAGSSDDSFAMPEWGVKRITSLPEVYVDLVAKAAEGLVQPEYSCRPEVVV